MVYPERLHHRIKYYFWLAYTPYHPLVRDGALRLRLIRRRGRQPFLLGTIAPGVSIEEFVRFLIEKGYAYHRVAWEDDGELVSLRYVEDFAYQYHIRVFEDGEVRGHYEYTPECYPLKHLREIGQEDRRERFLALFGTMLIPHTSDDPASFEWGFLPRA